jgi:hypothetical protein
LIFCLILLKPLDLNCHVVYKSFECLQRFNTLVHNYLGMVAQEAFIRRSGRLSVYHIIDKFVCFGDSFFELQYFIFSVTLWFFFAPLKRRVTAAKCQAAPVT